MLLGFADTKTMRKVMPSVTVILVISESKIYTQIVLTLPEILLAQIFAESLYLFNETMKI